MKILLIVEVEGSPPDIKDCMKDCKGLVEHCLRLYHIKGSVTGVKDATENKNT